MPGQRLERINSVLQAEISDIVRREMEDPHITFLTVTGADVSSDLSYADIFISVLGSEEEFKATLKTLRHASRFIRWHLSRRMELRHIPQLRFKPDETAARAQRIEQLFHGTDSGEAPLASQEQQGDEG